MVPSAQGQAPAALSAPAAQACPVQTPVRGNVAAYFVADGQYVKRGQLVVKMEAANGQATYINAPATGRIRFIPQHTVGPLPPHTVLGTIQVAVTH